MTLLPSPQSGKTLADSLMETLAQSLILPSQDKQVESDPVEWIEKHYWIPETKGPIELVDYQKRVIREALSRDANGLFKYSTVIWSDVKKSAKSSIAAAVALWFCFHTEHGEIYAVANDLKQADSRVARYFRRSLQLNPETRELPRTRGNLTTFPWGTIFEPLPIDPSGEAGGNPDFVVFSELWGAHEGQKESMWTEMTTPPTKFGKSMRWVETYAGYSGESRLLERQYHKGKAGYRLWDDLPVWVNEESRMLMMWNQEPRCPWQTPEYYTQQESELMPNEFRRIHRNEWVTSEDIFVSPEWWDACKDMDVPDERHLEPWIIALDAGVSSDTFGMVGVTRHPTLEEHMIVRYARRWIPTKGMKIDFQGTPENPGPELELRRLIAEKNVVQVALDPYQLHDMATRIKRERIVWIKSFNQVGDRLKADSALRRRIIERKIHHGGNAQLTEHIYNANAKIDENEDRKIRIVKRSDDLKVDLAVTLSMADFECMRLNL